MYIEIVKDINSDSFRKVVKLGDLNAKTLGFLPYEAFEKYAKQGQIIGAFETESLALCGYLLYRVSFNKVTIVHCCVAKEFRNKNVATSLVDYLKKNTKKYDGIRLSCRNDYGIDHLWESCNFVPIKEKQGRGKKGMPLTIWWFPHDSNDLLSLISDYELKNKIVAVIDMNVFLDIKNKRHEESLALSSDWILAETILYVTREIHVEINRAKTRQIKESSRKLLKSFQILPFKDEAYFKETFRKLAERFPEKTKTVNDRSDLNHLAYSIIAGAQYFITRDEDLLQDNSFFDQFNLRLFRPSEFIGNLDENLQTSKYKPQKLIGSSISSKKLTVDTIHDYVSLFLQKNERKSHFQKIVRDSLAFPNKVDIITVERHDRPLSFIILDRKLENRLVVPIFRFSRGVLRTTLAKHMLYKTINLAIVENRPLIEICDSFVSDDLQLILKESRFTYIDKSWYKLNINGVLNEGKLNGMLNSLENDISPVARKILLGVKGQSTNLKRYNIERYLYPMKLRGLEIDNFIVPIKPKWAERLFIDNSREKLPLFEPDYELLLNRENVYYRSAQPKILNSNSRILWYVSHDALTKKNGGIIAASYVDEVFIETPKKLFKQFEQLGVYTWNHVSDTAKGKNRLMAFIFSDTELFKRPIPLHQVHDVFRKTENKKFMIVTPIKIKIETYLAIYKSGMKL